MTVRELLEATAQYDPSLDQDEMIRRALTELLNAQKAMDETELRESYALCNSTLADRIYYSHQKTCAQPAQA